MEKDFNPFIVKGYFEDRYFCDREKETERIVGAMKNYRNLTVFSVRRMGKSALIQHAFQKIKKQYPNSHYFYIDLMPTNTLADFTNELGKAILGKLDNNIMRFLKELKSIITNVSPQIQFDEVSGQPQIELGLRQGATVKPTLDEIFTYMDKHARSKRIYIALDEFQQILEYPEKNVEALLRSKSQLYPKIGFIYSGSSKHLLSAMFSSSKRPFYHSTELMELKAIDTDKYIAFIRKHFTSARIKTDKKELAYILEELRYHTYYIQYLCHQLYYRKPAVISRKLIDETLQNIVEENEGYYYNYRNLLTDNQWQLLKAVAKEGVVKKIVSQKFITRYGLNAVSTIQTSLKALMEREFILYDEDGYKVYDVFFSKWLNKLP